MAACLALVLLLCSCCGEARVRLNAIRTVILREGHALPVNRSAWEPGLDLTVSSVPAASFTITPKFRQVTSGLSAGLPVHERSGVCRGELLPRRHQGPRPLALPDLPPEEEAMP